MSLISEECGVRYCHVRYCHYIEDKFLTVVEYHWQRISNKQTGTNKIAIFGNPSLARTQLLTLLNWWNCSDDWKYWS